MQLTETKISYTVCENNGLAVPVIIAAAGSSSRMQGENKQLLSLCGEPLIVRTVRKFQNSPYISRIIVVTQSSTVNEFERLFEEYSLNKVSDILEGAADRQGSVLNGLGRLKPDEDRVLIHDGARPFVSEAMIENCVEELYRNEAVLCAVKVVDTVKSANENRIVKNTVDRSGLYLAQTPQGVRVSLYKSALEKRSDTVSFTDDASVMESAGYSVKIVDGARYNIKITEKSDIPLANMLIRNGF